MYARFNTWRKDGSWQGVWLRLLRQNGANLGCSSVQLDGRHTPAKNGGEAVGYQARKKVRTTTALFLADNRGKPLAWSNRSTPGSTASKPCSFATKPVSAIG